MESQRRIKYMKKMMAQLHEDTVLKIKRVQTYLQSVRHRNVSTADVLDLILAQDVLVMKFIKDNNIKF